MRMRVIQAPRPAMLRRLLTKAKPRVLSFHPFGWRRGVAATVVMDNQEKEQGGDPNGTSEHSSGGGGGPTAETPDEPEVELKRSEKAVEVDEEATTDDTPAVDQPDPPPSPKRSRGTFRRFFSNFLSYDRTSSDPESEKIDFSQLPIEKKRNYYKCREDYLTLSDVPLWSEGCKSLPRPKMKKRSEALAFSVDDDLNGKVSLWRGDITRLEIDAIVNAANSSLLGGGGVDGAIHTAAGRGLLRECRTLGGCDAGDAKLTQGYRLPAKYVLHTVGPMNNKKAVLESCYRRCLELALVHNIRSLAFPCIATGVYGFPNEKAAQIALVTTRKWLEENREKVDRIIFCVFLEADYKLYCKYLHYVYPIEPSVIEDSQERVPGAAREDNRPLKPTMVKSLSTPPTKGGSGGKASRTESDSTSSMPTGSGVPINSPLISLEPSSSANAPPQTGEVGEGDGDKMELEEQGDKEVKSEENNGPGGGEGEEKEQLKSDEERRERRETSGDGGEENRGDSDNAHTKDPGFES